jgi:hypothetical protein
VAAKSGSATCAMSWAAWLKSVRVANAHSNPTVAKSRKLVTRNLRMELTPFPGSGRNSCWFS